MQPYKKSDKLVIGITIGDPSGIGPEVVLKALGSPQLKGVAKFLIIGSYGVVQRTMSGLHLQLAVDCSTPLDRADLDTINILDIHNIPEEKFEVGKANLFSGKASVEYIDEAVRLAMAKSIDAMVTAPVNKLSVNLAGYSFEGHTEYIANATTTADFAMMLVGGPLKVTLVTRHVSLKDIPRLLTEDKIYKAIALTHRALRTYFEIEHPRIGICGLNPHGGEGGIFGDEEIKIIEPTIARARRDIPGLIGPLAADSAFHKAYRGEFDALVSMYHDQGLIPLKMIAQEIGVNITLGLPFIRTSPDHGTAFDIAGKGKANPQSMIEAIKLAVQIGAKQLRNDT